mmetsp:Transcript_9520/g.11421  ORF Transcript_9520/g.11421 Transcript_9520/m.11421 type:complete len:511 (-) Transcript_9520:88-1620(-)
MGRKDFSLKTSTSTFKVMLTAATVSGGLVYWVVKSKEHRESVEAKTRQLNGIPGDMGTAFAGETVHLLLSTNLTGFVRSRHEKYGSVFKTHLFGENVVFVSGIDCVKSVLFSEPKYSTSFQLGKLRQLFGEESIVNKSGELHKCHNQMIMGVLNKRFLTTVCPNLAKVISEEGKKWLEESTENKGQYFSVKEKSISLVEKIIELIFFGKRSGTKVLKTTVEQLEAFSRGCKAFPVKLPFSPYGKAMKARQALINVIKNELSKHLNERSRLGVQAPEQTIIYHTAEFMSESTSSGERILALDEVADTMLFILWSLYESTVKIVNLCFLFAAKNRKLMQRMNAEAASLLGASRENGMYFLQELKQLKYTEACAREILRIYEPIVFVHRALHSDMPIRWYSKDKKKWVHSIIPAGWKIAASLKETTRLNPNYLNRNSVEPQRFLPPRNEHEGDEGFGFLSFGKATRNCPAEAFTLMKMQIILLLLSRNYKVYLKDMENISIDPYQDFSFRLEG